MIKYFLVLGALLSILSTTALAETIVTESTSTSTVNSNTTNDSTIKSTPPSAVTPAINVTNSDLCAVGVGGSVQTQILGLSSGTTTIDPNCERLKLSKTLYDMGMKVAAVSVLCQDSRVFDAMNNAGTPCPVDGQIGPEAKAIWEAQPETQPQRVEAPRFNEKNILLGVLGIIALGAIASQ